MSQPVLNRASLQRSQKTNPEARLHPAQLEPAVPGLQVPSLLSCISSSLTGAQEAATVHNTEASSPCEGGTALLREGVWSQLLSDSAATLATRWLRRLQGKAGAYPVRQSDKAC